MIEKEEVFIIAGLTMFFIVVPYFYSCYEMRYKDDVSAPVTEPYLGVPGEFKRNFTIHIKIEDYADVEDVQIGFSNRREGKPEPVEAWDKCVEADHYHSFPEPLELLFVYSHGDHWLILGDNVGVRFRSGGETVEIGEVDLDFRISDKAYLAIYEHKIKALQILIREKETKIAFVWEGPLDEVLSECLVFRGLKGRLIQARFPLLNKVKGFSLVKGEEDIEKLWFEQSRDYIDALALELFDPVTSKTSTYFLTSENYRLYRVPYSENSSICGMTVRELEDAEIVFAGGEAFDYISPIDGKQYSLLRPTSIWKDKLPAPQEQARRLLIYKVGEEYFNTHFSLAWVEKNTFEPEEWLTRVVFQYNITVGNYSRVEDVSVYFDEEDFIISTGCVPAKDNLMSFNVTREEAIEIALREGSPTRILEIEAEIYYWRRRINGTRLNKYAWVVQFYLSPRKARTGSIFEVVIDVHTGDVYGVNLVRWMVES